MKAKWTKTIILFTVLILSLLLTSCNSMVTPEIPFGTEENISKLEELDYVCLDVPFEKYAGTNWCLPASTAMEFNYFGTDISQEKIASVIIEEGKSSVYKMVKFAKDLGFDAEYVYMSTDEIKEMLRQSIPVIAVQNYALSLPYSHARVIIGYDDKNQEIISNDPTAGENYRIPYSNFEALNTCINQTLCKVIVVSKKEFSTKNIMAENNVSNS